MFARKLLQHVNWQIARWQGYSIILAILSIETKIDIKISFDNFLEAPAFACIFQFQK